MHTAGPRSPGQENLMLGAAACEFTGASKARAQPSPAFCPNPDGENKLHRGRAGLHPKPVETND